MKTLLNRVWPIRFLFHCLPCPQVTLDQHGFVTQLNLSNRRQSTFIAMFLYLQSVVLLMSCYVLFAFGCVCGACLILSQCAIVCYHLRSGQPPEACLWIGEG